MMKTQNTSQTTLSPKPRQQRNRELTSRFLSSSMESSECLSPSPVQRKSLSPSDNNNRRHKITEEPVFTRQQLWPSLSKNNSGTLAEHITQDRIIEQKHKDKDKPTNTKTRSVVFQRSYKEFETDETSASISSREIGGSMRYTGRFSSTKKLGSNSNGLAIVPGRLSLDENAKHFSSSSRRSSNVSSSLDSDSQYSDGDASTTRKNAVEVPSRFMSETTSRRSRRGTSDSNIGNLSNNGDLLKATIKRVNSVTGYNKNSKSQWALSPGRSEFSSPTKVKGVEKLFNFGFDLFKSKKQLVLNSPTTAFGNSDDVHKLRLLDNRFIQWRYVNAKSQLVNASISCQAQSNLVCAWDGLAKLRYSVMKKKIQFAREKLDMKIAFILYHQLKLLEAWGGMERQHVSSITTTKESLHSVVCRIPLIEGAKVNIPFTSIALRQTLDLTTSIKSILTSFPPTVDKTVAMLSELAKVVVQEKQLLDEFYDLFQTISILEFQERSVKCDLVQLQSLQRTYQPHQLLLKTTS